MGANDGALGMRDVVLPAAGTRHEPFFGGWYIPFGVDHALFVCLPIALVLARYARG